MNHADGFTFYGDLLGIGAAYMLGSEAAYHKLNTFYNTVFSRLEPICDSQSPRIHVQMFSDSLVVWGQGANEILEPLQEVYVDLIRKNLLMRGALVAGALEKEPRVEAKNFRKFLPTNDTLARAVGLEKTVKGSRMLIEPGLAHRLLASQPDWRTLEGYIAHLHPIVPLASPLRRICPTPSGTSYEFLYFWRANAPSEMEADGGGIADQLKEVIKFYDARAAGQLRETLKVLKRSELRRRRTERAFSAL